jgi:hypothetical protein
VAGLVSTIVPDFTFTDGPAGRIACSVRRTGGRRSNRGSDWRLVTATSVRAHSADRRPGAGHRARRPGAQAQPGAPDAYAPIWLLRRIVRTCHDTATCPRQNCLHAQRRPRRAHGGNLHLVAEKASLRPLFDDPLRGSTIVTCPGNIQSPGPWRRNATPQQVSGTLVCSYGLAAVTWDHRANLLVQRRPCQSNWAGAQPALPMVVGALLTSRDQGRHDGCPHRLGRRQEGGVTLKLGLRGFVWRCGCACHNDPFRAGRLF